VHTYREYRCKLHAASRFPELDNAVPSVHERLRDRHEIPDLALKCGNNTANATRKPGTSAVAMLKWSRLRLASPEK
jgi:hypothetical protein